MKMYLPPPGVRSSRRVVLKRGLWGGLLLTLGGGGWLVSRPSAVTPVPPGLKVLSPREYAVVASLVLRFIPRRQGFPRPEELDTAAAVDAIVALQDPSAQVELKRLLLLFENALPNFLLGLRTRPFTRLPVEEQERVLLEWRDSVLTLRRSGYLALRTLVNAAYYGAPAVWPALGYPGPPAGQHDPGAPVWRGPSPEAQGGGTP